MNNYLLFAEVEQLGFPDGGWFVKSPVLFLGRGLQQEVLEVMSGGRPRILGHRIGEAFGLWGP